jgi:hypothetical protein
MGFLFLFFFFGVTKPISLFCHAFGYFLWLENIHVIQRVIQQCIDLTRGHSILQNAPHAGWAHMILGVLNCQNGEKLWFVISCCIGLP